MENKEKAFSLVELMVVLAIMAVLGSISVVMYSKYTTQTRSRQGYTALVEIKAKQEQYRARHLTYADDLSKLPGFDDTVTGKQAVGDNFYVIIDSASRTAFKATAWDGQQAVGSKSAGSDKWEITQDDDKPTHVSEGY